MLQQIVNIVLVVVLMCLSVSGEFADDLKLCKYGDTECIKATVNFLFKEKSQGLDSIGLQTLSPLKYEKVHLHQGAESPVTLDMILKNQSLYGFETAKVVKLKGFGKDMTMKHSAKIHINQLSSVGDYDVKGKILILPIVGSGKSNITFVDLDLIFSFVGKPVEKNGATYMDIDHLTLNIEPKNIHFKVDNLFNGDKALGENMNLFLNQNAMEIYKEVRISLSEGFGHVLKDIIKSVFSKNPYNKYFTE